MGDCIVRVKDKTDWLGAGWMKFLTLAFRTSGSKLRIMSRVVSRELPTTVDAVFKGP